MTAIDLVVGELSSIVDDSVQFYWDLIAEDTAAAGNSSVPYFTCSDQLPSLFWMLAR